MALASYAPGNARSLLCTQLATPPGNDARITAYNMLRNATFDAVRQMKSMDVGEAVGEVRRRLEVFYSRVWSEFDVWDCYGLRDPPVRADYEMGEASDSFSCPEQTQLGNEGAVAECPSRASIRKLREECSTARPWLAPSGLRDELMDVLLEIKPPPDSITADYRSFYKGVFDGSLFRETIDGAFVDPPGLTREGCRQAADARAGRILRKIQRAGSTPPPTPTLPVNQWQRVPYSDYAKYSTGGNLANLRSTFGGCNELWVHPGLSSNMPDTAGIPTRLASGWWVDDACKRSVQSSTNDDLACVAAERQLASEVASYTNKADLTPAQKTEKIILAQARHRIGACSSGQSQMERQGREVCDKYLGIGIHLAECDCIESQPPLLGQIAQSCIDSPPADPAVIGYSMSANDCNRINNAAGLPSRYKETRDVRTANLMGRFLTRSMLNLDHAKGQDKYCIYPACSNATSRTWKNVLKSEGIGLRCDGPQCVINIKAEWIGGDAIIENNVFELNCSGGGSNECSNNGSKNAQGNCVCRPGFAGANCELRVGTGGAGGGGSEERGNSTGAAAAAAAAPAAQQSLIGTTEILYIVGGTIVALIFFAFLIKRSRGSQAEDQAAAEEQQYLVAQQQAEIQRTMAELRAVEAKM